MKLEGKPPIGGTAEAVGGLDGPLLGCGVGGPALDNENAFILAAMSGFMAVGGPLPARGAPGGLRAASNVPRGVDEAVMFDMLEGMLLSEVPLGALDRGSVGLASGDAPMSSGEVGGEGLSRGLVGSSWESAIVIIAARRETMQGDGVAQMTVGLECQPVGGQRAQDTECFRARSGWPGRRKVDLLA